jgi:predicted GNAT family acetyltransferase
MEIKHVEKGGRGGFVIREDGKRLAEMTYVIAGETGFIIDHTEIDYIVFAAKKSATSFSPKR